MAHWDGEMKKKHKELGKAKDMGTKSFVEGYEGFSGKGGNIKRHIRIFN